MSGPSVSPSPLPVADTARPFMVRDTVTGASRGKYETLEQAHGCVAFDRLREWQIWCDDQIVASSDD